jgi:leucyl aminopeptidase
MLRRRPDEESRPVDCFSDSASSAIPITPLTKERLGAWVEQAGGRERAWVKASGFTAEKGKVLLVPAEDGGLARILAGVDPEEKVWGFAGLPEALPPGTYRIDASLGRDEAGRAALGWALGLYAFTRYKEKKREPRRLAWPEAADRGEVERLARAIFLVRDLVNTPAEDMGPDALADAAETLAGERGAKFEQIVGDDLLARNYPTIHAVGRASSRAPRLLDLGWGREGAPKVTLVGKGVCFDTGGLDLKPAAGMKIMKKDMGGAATVLGLASAVIEAGLDLRLRVLVPAVENSVSANAFRPLDVIRTRKGITVEIGNTDAEGRLILCDALAEADSESPEVLIDCATLTGAARVALGPDLPALYANDDALADALLAASRDEGDPMWRMPLWKPYRKMLESRVADINNVSDGPFAGSITAALYLQDFVSAKTPWAHFDLYAWNAKSTPGRPEGGEAQCLRAIYALLKQRYPAR